DCLARSKIHSSATDNRAAGPGRPAPVAAWTRSRPCGTAQADVRCREHKVAVTHVDPEQSTLNEHALFVELAACSGIIAPMLAGERVVGALSLGAARRYCQTDLDLAVELASSCAQAIENARLYLVARRATQVRDTLLAAISHDLKNPLATIGAQAQLLRRARS